MYSFRHELFVRLLRVSTVSVFERLIFDADISFLDGVLMERRLLNVKLSSVCNRNLTWHGNTFWIN